MRGLVELQISSSFSGRNVALGLGGLALKRRVFARLFSAICSRPRSKFWWVSSILARLFLRLLNLVDARLLREKAAILGLALTMRPGLPCSTSRICLSTERLFRGNRFGDVFPSGRASVVLKYRCPAAWRRRVTAIAESCIRSGHRRDRRSKNVRVPWRSRRGRARLEPEGFKSSMGDQRAFAL